MLLGKATLPLWFEPSQDYVGPAVTEIIYGPVGLIGAGFSAVGLFLGRKSKISYEQNVKEFQFYIRMTNFWLLGSIIKKKYLKVADPLKKKVKERLGKQIIHALRKPISRKLKTKKVLVLKIANQLQADL